MDLPPPGPNALELAFRRLLLKCEEQAWGSPGGGGAAGGDGGLANGGGGGATTEGEASAAASAAVRGRSAAATIDGGVIDWRVDPKFHCYVDLLREQLQALEGVPDAAAASLPGTRTPPPAPAIAGALQHPPPPLPAAPAARDRLPPDVLALYRARVRALSEALRQPAVPAFCLGRASALAGSAIAALRGGGGGGGAAAGGGAGAAKGPAATNEAASEAASLLLQRPAGAPRRPKAAATSATAAATEQQQQQQAQQKPLRLGKEATARLTTQQALQDDLAEELLGMTSELKASATAMQGALRQRGRLVDDAERLLDASAVAARSNARRAGEQYRRSRAGFCQTCLVMVVVALVFAGMIVWIKVTSMVGLGRRKGRGWLW